MGITYQCDLFGLDMNQKYQQNNIEKLINRNTNMGYYITVNTPVLVINTECPSQYRLRSEVYNKTTSSLNTLTENRNDINPVGSC